MEILENAFSQSVFISRCTKHEGPDVHEDGFCAEWKTQPGPACVQGPAGTVGKSCPGAKHLKLEGRCHRTL